MQLQSAGVDQALGEDRARCSNNVISLSQAIDNNVNCLFWVGFILKVFLHGGKEN